MVLGRENLVYKAASALLSGTRYGVEILIEKNLPAGGGLGGGSPGSIESSGKVTPHPPPQPPSAPAEPTQGSSSRGCCRQPSEMKLVPSDLAKPIGKHTHTHTRRTM